MVDEKIEVSGDGLSQLQSAVRDFARAEINRIVHVLIVELRSRLPEGIFEDIHARHFWDEYCWAVQEETCDEPTMIGAINYGSIFDGFASFLHAFILAEVEKLPEHRQIFMSALAFEDDVNIDEDKSLGCIWIDGIVKLVVKAVNQHAAQRNLLLIGPDRAEAISLEIQGTGFVWSVLDSSVAMNLIQNYVDTITDAHADLSPLADEVVEAYLMDARYDEDGGVTSRLIEHFEKNIRSMIIEKDVLPALENMRRNLLEVWDG